MISFVGFITLFIIFLVVFKKRLKLRLISLKHGKYSYQYIKQFKRYANKSPFPYCFKDDIMPYLRLSQAKRDNTEQLRTEMNLLFEETKYQTPFLLILNKYGNPDYFNAFKIKNIELRALGYQKHVFDTKAKAVFFFLNESFVMGEYIIEDISGIDLTVIGKKLMDQTGIKQINSFQSLFVDGKNNSSIFFYENGFSLIIRYSDLGNKQFNELIQ
jgi:hypothetical protein